MRNRSASIPHRKRSCNRNFSAPSRLTLGFRSGRQTEGVLNTFNWQGASGRWYEFEIARAQRAWEPVGGIYMFVKPHDQPSLDWGGPIALYAAYTDDFSRSLARHDMWQA